MVSVNPLSGMGALVSYRDPHIEQTLDTYESVPAALKAASEMPQADIDKYIVGTIGSLDSPMGSVAASSLSVRRYLLGISGEDVAARRAEVLATTGADIEQVAGRWAEALAAPLASVATSTVRFEALKSQHQAPSGLLRAVVSGTTEVIA
jgi:hypothetical protein